MPSKTEVYDAIRTGAKTNADIADCDLVNSNDRKNVARDTKSLVESGDLNKKMEGGEYVFSIPQNAERQPDTQVGDDETAQADDGKMRVVRNYDWDEKVEAPDDVGDYFPTGNEWQMTNAMVDRRMKGAATNFRLGGPTGAAKTLMARRFAAVRGWPCFTFQCSPATTPGDVYGSPTVGGEGESVWVDSTVVKALLCSRDRPTVLILDEVNRAPSDIHDTLMDALDDRCSVTLEGPRGGEEIAGNPDNLIVFSTMNQGREYSVNPLDPAFKSRISQGGMFELDYLGRADADAEAELVMSKSGVPQQAADMFVDVANQTRDLADDRNSDLNRGIPTRDLLSWANGAVQMEDAGMDDALVATGEQQIVKSIWDARDADARQTVRNIVESTFGNVSLEDFETDEDRIRMTCRDCDFGAWREDVPDSALDFHECPDCGGMLKESLKN